MDKISMIQQIEEMCQLAQHYTAAGNFDKADEILENTLQLVKTEYGERNTSYCDVLRLRANNAWASGDLKRSSRLLEKAINILETIETEDARSISVLLLSLGSLTRNLWLEARNRDAEYIFSKAKVVLFDAGKYIARARKTRMSNSD